MKRRTAAGKGIVIHIDARAAHVMTPRGEIHRVDPNQWERQPVPGEEVTFTVAPPATRPGARRKRGSFLLALVPLAASAALALFLHLPALTTVATVAVDINPSVELGVTSRGIVRQAEGVNADGRALLAAVQVEGERLDRALEELAVAAVRSGKLPRGGLLVATVGPRRAGVDVAPLEELARAGVRAGIRRAAGSATVVVAAATDRQLEAAHAAGIPLGKHLAAEAARQAGSAPEATAFPRLSLSEILRQAGIGVEQAFSGSVEDVGPAPPDRPLLPGPGEPQFPQEPGPLPGLVPPGLPTPGDGVPGMPQPLPRFPALPSTPPEPPADGMPAGPGSGAAAPQG